MGEGRRGKGRGNRIGRMGRRGRKEGEGELVGVMSRI